MKYATLIAALFCLLLIAKPSQAELELKQDDSVVVVGNTFAERLALSGYLDAMIHAANPGKNIVVRSVPNSADEVYRPYQEKNDDKYDRSWRKDSPALKKPHNHNSPREVKVPRADFYLNRHAADVVVMCYGMGESFDGPAGLDEFKKDLAAHLDWHLSKKYNGTSTPQVVLVSPIAHEDLGNPNLPTGEAVSKRNAAIKAYTNAMKEMAADKKVLFIDLFTPSADLYQASDAPLTSNGITINELGCFYFAGEMAKQLGWWDGKAADASDHADALRQIAYDKHYHFRHRYRPTNTEYVWGRRHGPHGKINFPPELEQLDRMVAAREQAIWQLKDKPTAAQLFAAPPSGKAIWETPPLTYDYPGDKYAGVEIPLKNIAKDKKAGDPSRILPPEEYIKTFQVADGYQVNLFASEREFPELANPLAITFDYKGRLWVLCAPTYPHPYPGEVSDCKLIILDDTDGDGQADQSTIFARHMAVPTGFAIDANGEVYIGQAPDLWKLTDTDGDDVADRKEMVYSGFGTPDSHHTISAFVWDPNGGLLMSEGVFCRANIETPYGNQRTRDAAVWRLDPRTQKLIAVSHTPHPNPWGHSYDQYGQSIYMDTSGAAQYNFSSLIAPYLFPDKPKLGPVVIERGRPCAGAELIYSSHFPDDVQGTYVHNQAIGFLGTNWERLKEGGTKHSGYTAEPMPQPILSSKIGNYRPVCSELGADGALYIADWVNPLIGHMQFNIRDPRRDHSHGRIYRVTHQERPLVKKIDLTKLDLAGLLEQLKSTELNTRDRARRLLQTMDRDKVVAAVNDWVFKQLDPRSRDYDYERLTLEALWIQQGHGVYDTKLIDEVTRARNPMVVAGAIRAIRYGLQYGDADAGEVQPFVAQAVTNRDMRVRLEAVMACAFLDSPTAIQIANRVTTLEMDDPIRNAHTETTRFLNHKGLGAATE